MTRVAASVAPHQSEIRCASTTAAQISFGAFSRALIRELTCAVAHETKCLDLAPVLVSSQRELTRNIADMVTVHGVLLPPVCHAIVNHMPRVLSLVIVLLLVLTATPAAATTVLAIRQGVRILIAADSLRIGTTDQGSRIPHLACKVRNYGDIAFAAVAHYQLPVFPPALADNLLPRYDSEPIRYRIARFREEAQSAFTRLHNLIHNTRERSDDMLFTYVLGFFEAGRPVLLKQSFTSTGGVLNLEDVEEIGDNRLFPAGQRDFLKQEDLVVRIFRKEEDTAQVFDEIIRLQARLTPDMVGGPPDIIELTAKGAEWLQSKRGCRRATSE